MRIVVINHVTLDGVMQAPGRPEVRLWARYESLLNLTFSGSPVSLLCPYDRRSLGPEIVRHALATHPRTQERDALAPSADYADPSGFVLEP